jgi:hypothetical protein
MPVSAYRFKTSITAAIQEEGRYRLRELPAGSVFCLENSKLAYDCMLDGTWNGAETLVFVRDLDEQAELIAAE